MIGVGETFPDFTLEGIDWENEIYTETLEGVMDYGTEWAIIYFYPKDFTFICPTEILGFDEVGKELCNTVNPSGHGLLDVSVWGISPDNEYCKLAWKKDNDLIRGTEHSLLADSGNVLANELGIVGNGNVPYRATYVVNTFDGRIHHVSVTRTDTGRNPDEIKRTVMALSAEGLTGCNWQAGDDFVA